MAALEVQMAQLSMKVQQAAMSNPPRLPQQTMWRDTTVLRPQSSHNSDLRMLD